MGCSVADARARAAVKNHAATHAMSAISSSSIEFSCKFLNEPDRIPDPEPRIPICLSS
jgi:hypothetical protein